MAMKYIISILLFTSAFVFTNCGAESKQVPDKPAPIASDIHSKPIYFTQQKSISDTFPLPQDKHQPFQIRETASRYFESACARTVDWPGDSIATLLCIREYQMAIKLDKKYWYAYRNLSRCFSRFNRNDLAMESLNKAIEYGPGMENAPELYAMRAGLFYDTHNFKAAIPDFQNLVNIGYSPQAYYYYYLALATLKNGEKEKAALIIKNAKGIDFSDYDLKMFEL
jgi:hypothetical protein